MISYHRWWWHRQSLLVNLTYWRSWIQKVFSILIRTLEIDRSNSTILWASNCMSDWMVFESKSRRLLTVKFLDSLCLLLYSKPAWRHQSRRITRPSANMKRWWSLKLLSGDRIILAECWDRELSHYHICNSLMVDVSLALDRNRDR